MGAIAIKKCGVVARGKTAVSFVVQRFASVTMQSLGSTASVFGLSSEFASSLEDFFFTLLLFSLPPSPLAINFFDIEVFA
jgi:hypothetical protein